MRSVIVSHLKQLIRAAVKLEIPIVNTFIGRDHTKSVDENWQGFLAVWPGIVAQADAFNIKIGIENCPMYFTDDEWPGGKNLANTPAFWRRMWKHIPSGNFGLNYDPSHMIWQQMNYLNPLEQFQTRMHHIHAKDAVIDQDRLNEVGILAPPNEWHTPKLPGLGSVDWKAFIQTLRQIDYQGAICVEVEDRDFEGTEALRIEALRKSYQYLRPLLSANN
jgi:sugar phosphate isomerase/epimerase